MQTAPDRRRHGVRFTAREDENHRCARRPREALERLVAPGFSYATAAPGVRDREALKHCLRREFDASPDARETAADRLTGGDKVAVRHAFSGTRRGTLGPSPPSGRRLCTDPLAIDRIAGGLIAKAWAKWDPPGGLVQLGRFRPPDEPAAG
jgi:predicted ester cyclase